MKPLIRIISRLPCLSLTTKEIERIILKSLRILIDFNYLCGRELCTTKQLGVIVLQSKGDRILRESQHQKEPRHEI